MAEILKQCPAYFPHYFKLVMFHCENPDDQVNRNIVYALSVLLEYAQKQIAPELEKVIHALKTIFEKTKDAECKDNVVAAVCKIVKFHDPIPELVKFIVENIPLEHDKNENETVMKCFMYLYDKKPMLIKPHWKKALQTFVKVITDE